jgi:hypothetical protein
VLIEQSSQPLAILACQRLCNKWLVQQAMLCTINTSFVPTTISGLCLPSIASMMSRTPSRSNFASRSRTRLRCSDLIVHMNVSALHASSRHREVQRELCREVYLRYLIFAFAALVISFLREALGSCQDVRVRPRDAWHGHLYARACTQRTQCIYGRITQIWTQTLQHH